MVESTASVGQFYAAIYTQGMISDDGPKNIVDSVDYLYSRVWADDNGRNRAGMVLVQDQRVFAARDVMKADARPGGYVATGGNGGILGAAGHDGSPVLNYLPATRHTYQSEVNITKLPDQVLGVRRTEDGLTTVPVAVKTARRRSCGGRPPEGLNRQGRQLSCRRF